MTEEELQTLLEQAIAPRDRYDVFVEECQDQDIRLRFSSAQGEGWPTPALLALVDISLRAAAGADTSLTHLAVTVLRPAQAADVIALSRVIRREGRTVHAEAWLFSHAAVEPMLHGTATLRTPA